MVLQILYKLSRIIEIHLEILSDPWEGLSMSELENEVVAAEELETVEALEEAEVEAAGIQEEATEEEAEADELEAAADADESYEAAVEAIAFSDEEEIEAND